MFCHSDVRGGGVLVEKIQLKYQLVKIYLMLSDITRRGIRKYLLISGDSLDTS